MGAAIFPHVAGYDSAKKAVIGTQYADIILQKKQTNGPARRGGTILPDGRSNIRIQQNRIPQYADIILQKKADQWARASRRHCMIYL